MIFSGECSATASISTPPSVLAMIVGPPVRAVHQDGEIKFLGDVHAPRDEHLIDQPPVRPGLVRDEHLPEHFAGDFPCFLRRLDEMHAALEAVLERALAAAARRGSAP